jgi:hypothetical protein
MVAFLTATAGGFNMQLPTLHCELAGPAWHPLGLAAS